jgi:hypothetical protein
MSNPQTTNPSTFFDFQQANKNVLVITDLEADDYFAVLMLVALTKTKLAFIVSCWTNPAEKAAILRKVLDDAGSSAPVYYGLPTDKVYDLQKLKALLSINDLPAAPPLYTNELFEVADFILSLSPPRELVAAYVENPAVFSGKRAAFYGSFNLRYCFKEKLFTADQALAMIKSFEAVIWYETFFARGANNTIADNAVLERITSQFPQLRAITSWWNGAIYAECEAENPQSDLDRKIMASITAAPNQMVDADCGLVVYLLKGNPYVSLDAVDLSFTERFTVLTDNPSSNVAVVRTAPDAVESARIHTYGIYSNLKCVL